MVSALTHAGAKLISRATNLFIKISEGLRRFPETMFMCMATVAVLIVLNHSGYDRDFDVRELLTRLAMILALGIPLSLGIKVFFEKVPTLKKVYKTAIYSGALALLMLYFFFLLDRLDMITISRYVALSLSLYLVFASIPYFFRRDNFELYVIKLFIIFVITCLYAFTLFLGLAAILGTISYLFDVHISSSIYLDIFLIVAGVFGPALLLSGIPGRDEDVSLQSYPKILHVLLTYIIIPLLIAYCVILYAYFVRVALTARWPEIMVSHLVLWYAIVCTLVIFFIYPLRRINQWIKSFTAYFPVAILPLLLMMFTAMGIRLHAYGITEKRYFVLAAGLWVTGSMLYYILNKSSRNIILPVSLALVAVLAVWGPWSSYSVSVYSQNKRFDKLMHQNNLLKDGRIVMPPGEITKADREEISSIIIYFHGTHGFDRLRLLPEGFEFSQMEKVFGFPLYHDPYFRNGDIIYFSYMLEYGDHLWEISGFDYFLELSTIINPVTGGKTGDSPRIEISYSPGEHELIIFSGGEAIYRQDIKKFLFQMHRENVSKDVLSPEKMTFVDEKRHIKVRYIFKWISGFENRGTGEITFDPPQAFILVKIARQ